MESGKPSSGSKSLHHDTLQPTSLIDLPETVSATSARPESQSPGSLLPKLKQFLKTEISTNTVGDVTEESQIVRIVHVSDTHMNHNDLLNSIPDGDIFIHSGDFVNYNESLNIERDVLEINNFFAKLPHKHKIFVAGNHETSFGRICDRPKYIDNLLDNGIYLQDRSVTLEGVKIYGSPWNTSYGMAFYSNQLESVWAKVPNDTDILVTHSPPFGIRDFGYNKFWYTNPVRWLCQHCTERRSQQVYHGEYAHQGCAHLRQAIFNTIRPKAHLFGHVHNHNGTSWEDGILFSNAAIQDLKRPSVIDFHRPDTSGKSDSKKPKQLTKVYRCSVL